MRKGERMDQPTTTGIERSGRGHGITRRQAFLRMGALGAGTALLATSRAWGQAAKPKVALVFWTWENPQQRPYIFKRIKLYTEAHPSVQVDTQHFAFSDLGKKVSVGFATGTAPDGFATGDWLMPSWLARNLIAPLEPAALGYASVDAFRKDHADAFVQGAIQDGKI